MADKSPRKMFVNLAVRDLKKSMSFFTKLGFEFNPKFTDDKAACMIISEEAFVMLLGEPFFRTFTQRELCDTTKHTEGLFALSCDSRDEVDEMVKKAAARFRMSRSSRSTRTSRRNRRSSSRSSVVSPSHSPASTAAWPTQRRTAVSLRSSSRQIAGNDRSPCRTKAMTSALNFGVNDRRCRRRAPFPSTFFPIRTPSSWAHAHI